MHFIVDKGILKVAALNKVLNNIDKSNFSKPFLNKVSLIIVNRKQRLHNNPVPPDNNRVMFRIHDEIMFG